MLKPMIANPLASLRCLQKVLRKIRNGRRRSAVSETRKLVAILVSDLVGYSRLAGADEDRTLARLRTAPT
jgi:class 3 adenylate cyclase